MFEPTRQEWNSTQNTPPVVIEDNLLSSGRLPLLHQVIETARISGVTTPPSVVRLQNQSFYSGIVDELCALGQIALTVLTHHSAGAVFVGAAALTEGLMNGAQGLQIFGASLLGGGFLGAQLFWQGAKGIYQSRLDAAERLAEQPGARGDNS